MRISEGCGDFLAVVSTHPSNRMERGMYSTSTQERFWRKVNKQPDGCWNWTGAIHKTMLYGSFGTGNGKIQGAHRVSYCIANGPLPKGMVIDHICRNRTCVNPSHLRLATYRQNAIENSVSGPAINVRKTHCAKGHEYTEENTGFRPNGNRRCLACRKAEQTARNKGFKWGGDRKSVDYATPASKGETE